MSIPTTLTLIPLPCRAHFERYPLRRSYSLPLGRPCFQCGAIHRNGETSCTHCDASLCESRSGWFSVAIWRRAPGSCAFPDYTDTIFALRAFLAVESLMRASSLYRASYVTARALDGSIIYHRWGVSLVVRQDSRQDNTDDMDDP